MAMAEWQREPRTPSSETVNTALREFCDRDTRVRLFAHIQQLAAGDLGDPEVMRGAHREWPRR